MGFDSNPQWQGEPILDQHPRPAFRISAEEICLSIKQQFPNRELAFRELGQNAVDAGASQIRVDFRFENERMVCDFLDNGRGMTDEIMRRHYLRLFDSSKETQEGQIGHFCLGRLSAFCYDPEVFEVVTLALDSPGYRLVIDAKMSGKYSELDREVAEKLIAGSHGTRVRLIVPVGTMEEFAGICGQAVTCMEKELGWISPPLTVTTVTIEEGRLAYGSRRLNRPMEVPGRFSSSLTVRLSSGRGATLFFIGLESGDNGSPAAVTMQPDSQTGLAPITLCTGSIPIERPAGLPWTGGKPFSLRGLRIILDSFQFSTSIGRNTCHLDTEFVRELLPKLFREIILGRFVKGVARLVSQPAFRAQGYESSIRRLLADVCIQSLEHDFDIPDELMTAPFIPSHVSLLPYSIATLDGIQGSIHYTWDKPSALTLRAMEEDNPDFACICLSELPCDFKGYLENRYGDRLLKKESRITVRDQDRPDIREMTRIVRSMLGTVKTGMSGHADLPPALPVSVGRFFTFDGAEERHVPTIPLKEPEQRISLNIHHSHIRDLIELMAGPDRPLGEVAAHYLLREILFDPDIALPTTYRELLLGQDLRRRFGLIRTGEGCRPSFLAEELLKDLSSLLSGNEDIEI